MTILVIEDDEDVASFLKRGLEAEGFMVKLARDGASGLVEAQADAPSLVILDLNLPRMDGLEVCREMRKHGSAAPILVLSARDALSDKVESFDAGADDYLTKPFAFEELLARVKALFRRGAGPATRPQRIAVGDLIYDRETMQVRRGERSIDLTSKEMAILDLLLSKPGAVFSRVKILSEVWDSASNPANNFVEVYIGRIRRKIDGENDAPLLETLRGRGYRIKADLGDP